MASAARRKVEFQLLTSAGKGGGQEAGDFLQTVRPD
jgi:hypothetical protein